MTDDIDKPRLMAFGDQIRLTLAEAVSQATQVLTEEGANVRLAISHTANNVCTIWHGIAPIAVRLYSDGTLTVKNAAVEIEPAAIRDAVIVAVRAAK